LPPTRYEFRSLGEKEQVVVGGAGSDDGILPETLAVNT
jgi:hypothetical protein